MQRKILVSKQQYCFNSYHRWRVKQCLDWREYISIAWFIPANVVFQIWVSFINPPLSFTAASSYWSSKAYCQAVQLHFSPFLSCNLYDTNKSLQLTGMKSMELHIFSGNALEICPYWKQVCVPVYVINDSGDL